MSRGVGTLPGLPQVATRLFGLASLVVMGAAIDMGRRNPPAPRPHEPRPCQMLWVEVVQVGDDVGSRMFEVETGRMIRLAVPEGSALKTTSVSPWQDDRGNWQVVGALTEPCCFSGNDRTEVSLVRVAQPGGRILDRCSAEFLPTGRPCWSPTGDARVLYAGTDGRLFRWSFEDPAGEGTDGAAIPRPLAWLTERPGGEGVHLRDLCWPADLRLGTRVVATLWSPREADGPSQSGQLWWLELDGDATAIVRAGRLRRERDWPSSLTERFAEVATTADGRLILAYLREEPGQPTWQLRVASLTIDERTGDPSIRVESERILTQGCLAVPPVFTADARWVVGLLASDPPPRRLRHFAVEPTASIPTATAESGGVP